MSLKHISRLLSETADSTRRVITRDDVIDILAAQPGNREKPRDYLSERWVASDVFSLMTIPLASIGVATVSMPKGSSVTQGPIIVDVNQTNVPISNGMSGPQPKVIVLDGKHRWYEASNRGEHYIRAFVGEKAKPYIEKSIQDYGAWREEVKESVENFLSSEMPGGHLRKLRHLLSPEEVDEIRTMRDYYIRTGEVPEPMLKKYEIDLASLTGW
jgi:hypothetical protein